MSRGISLVGLNRRLGGDTVDSTPVQCALDSRSHRRCGWTGAIGVGASERLKAPGEIRVAQPGSGGVAERFPAAARRGSQATDIGRRWQWRG